MYSQYPLFSVIVDNIEIGTVGSDEDAKSIAGDKVIFVEEQRPRNIIKLDNDISVEDFGYYTIR